MVLKKATVLKIIYCLLKELVLHQSNVYRSICFHRKNHYIFNSDVGCNYYICKKYNAIATLRDAVYMERVLLPKSALLLRHNSNMNRTILFKNW